MKSIAQNEGYSPLHVKKNLKEGKPNLIGLIVPSLKNQFFAEIASYIITEAKKKGYIVITLDSMENVVAMQKSISTLIGENVEGMIVAPCGDDPMWLEQINNSVIPVVLIDRFFENTTLSYVTTNNYLGGMRATNNLIASGHKNIVCIQGVHSSMPSKERVSGYVQAMESAGLKDNINVIGDEFTIQNGYISTKLILRGDNRPTAIFALSSTIMLGSLKAIREAGLKIPEDISIITFDNYFYLDFLEPPITRVDQPIGDMCSLAMNILIEKIHRTRESETQMRLSPTLIEGRSVMSLEK